METKKKNTLKSFLALTLAFIMVLGVSPIGELAGIDFAGLFGMKASAEDGTSTEGIYTYEIVDGAAKITDCDESAEGDITIPSELGGYPVTSIGMQAFGSCTGLTSVTIPGNVTNIEGGPFLSCENLKNIIVDDNNKN